MIYEYMDAYAVMRHHPERRDQMRKHEWLIKEIIDQYRMSGRGKLPLTMEFDLGFLDLPMEERTKLLNKLKELVLIGEFVQYGQDKARIELYPVILRYFDDEED